MFYEDTMDYEVPEMEGFEIEEGREEEESLALWEAEENAAFAATAGNVAESLEDGEFIEMFLLNGTWMSAADLFAAAA